MNNKPMCSVAASSLRLALCLIPSLLSVATALFLSGCATKSPPTMTQIHQQSGTLTNIALTNAWRAGGAPGQTVDNWLATFHDPQLNALVAEALTNNLDLRITASRVAQAAQYAEMAKAALRPAVNLLGTGGLNMGGGDVSSALQGASLGVSWEPDLWARLRYGRNAAQATHASAMADFEFSRQSLAATIAKGWFTASETGLQREISDAMIQAAQQLLTLAEKRAQVGAGTQYEVAATRANLATVQDAAKQIRLAHDQSLRGLEVLLGRYPAADLETPHTLSSLPGPVPTGLPLQMLERRPDMVAAERRVAAAFNRVGEAKAARLPRLILNANVAVIDSAILQLKDDFENPTGGVGGRLIAPIYQGGALQTQVRIRTLQEQAVAEFASMALRALSDVENNLAASQNLLERQPYLELALSESERALELAQTSYRVGQSDLRSVQQQLLNVHSARLALLRVRSEQLAQRVNLHLALGGNFESPVTLPPAESVSRVTQDSHLAATGSDAVLP